MMGDIMGIQCDAMQYDASAMQCYAVQCSQYSCNYTFFYSFSVDQVRSGRLFGGC